VEKQKVDLQFPVKGVVKGSAYGNPQQQISPYAMNVRPFEVFEGRARGGSRPGFERLALAPSTGPCRLLSTVNVKTGDKYDYWEDDFQYASASHYSAVAGFYETGSAQIPSFSNGVFYLQGSSTTPNLYGSCVFPYSVSMNFSAAFRLGVHAIPNDGLIQGAYYLFVGTFVNGYAAFIDFQSGAQTPYAGAFRMVGGVESWSNSSAFSTSAKQGWVEAEFNGTSLKIYWCGEQVFSDTLPASVSSYSATGFGMFGVAAESVKPQINRARLQYYRTTQYETVRPVTVYSQGGTVYKDSFVSKLTASAATRTLASDRQLMAAERGGLLFIADHSEAICSGSDGVITGTNSFDSATYSNWSTALTGYDKSDIGLVILSGNSPTTFSAANGNLISMPIGARITVTHGNLTLASTSGLSFTVGSGYRDTKMEFTGLPADIRTAMDGMVYRPEASYSTVFEITVCRLVDGEVVETTYSSPTSAGSNITYSTGAGNLITVPESGTAYVARLTVTNGTLTLASTSGITLYNGATGSQFGQVLMSGSPTNINAAMNGMTYTPNTGYTGQFTITLERLVNWVTVETQEHTYPVSQGNKSVGTHTISAIASGNLTISTAANNTALNFRIERTPKIYDPVNDTLTRWSAQPSYGMVPVGCSMVVRYRDRLVLAGDPLDPNEWYMSRQGDPYDWLFTDVDVGAAVKGSNSDAGRIGDAITALMTFNDDYLFFGCRSSLWILRGDPTAGGKIDSVSRTIGVLDRNSWCTGPAGEIIWLSREGLWVTNPECLTCTPVAISRETLPRELLNVNPLTAYVTMVYDVVDRGVHIYLTPRISSLTDTTKMPSAVGHWFLDWNTKGLFPVSFASKSHNPTTAIAYSGLSASDSTAIMAGYDGSLYRYSWTAPSDHGTAISSYVALGPIMIGDGMRDGMIREIRGTLGTDSNDVTWSLYAASTAENAVKETDAHHTGTFSAGHRNVSYAPSRCEAAVLKLSASEPWAMESVSMVLGKCGRARGDL
jgi:hypothetical protein